MNWEELKQKAIDAIEEKRLGENYANRLKFELSEINKQGAETAWLNRYNENKKLKTNPSYLVFPWLVGMLVDDTDPMLSRPDKNLNSIKASDINKWVKEHGSIPCDFVRDADMPDIDLDCLPEARDSIKNYATEKYGSNDDKYGSVCSVGTWQTYKFRSALIATCSAMGKVDKPEAHALTTKLPDDVDDLKPEGKAKCVGMVVNEQGIEVECGHKHALSRCPKCGSSDTNAPTIGKFLDEHDNLRAFAKIHPDELFNSIRLVGRVQHLGMHAGALIISNKQLYGNVPMAKAKDHWVSMWSEGSNTQLSRFGYVKWDILGLKTLKYIYNCCRLIEKNRGIRFGSKTFYNVKFANDIDVVYNSEQTIDGKLKIGDLSSGMTIHGEEITSIQKLDIPAMDGWEDIDPTKGRAGHFFDIDGNKHYIDLNDEHVLDLANNQKGSGIFQFDTKLAMDILGNGVKSFDDLMLLNAMGHPGPMASIPEAVANRDSTDETWRDNLRNISPKLYEILKDTYGVIVYQESLQRIWQELAGFTSPRAQEARKAVAKKRADKLRSIEDEWITGASKTIGRENAVKLWEKMIFFARYAFNRSHSVSYCLVTHRCFFLKAHFAPEFWAAVMSDCHPDKLVRYMGAARSEKWSPTSITNLGRQYDKADSMFDSFDFRNLTSQFSVTGNSVMQGMIGLKGVGEAASLQFEGTGEYEDIDDFVFKKKKNKTVLERFIKLNVFRGLPNHHNAKALWIYYQYKYCSGKDITALKAEIRVKLLEKEGWNEQTIALERRRQMDAYFITYPKRKKVPNKIQNWKPELDYSLKNIVSLFKDDKFSMREMLEFEKEYLGYYLNSPLDLYQTRGSRTIELAKSQADFAIIECIVVDNDFATTTKGKDYCRLTVSDGVQSTLVFIWNTELLYQDPENLVVDTGIQVSVQYDQKRSTFSLQRGSIIVRLAEKNADS